MPRKRNVTEKVISKNEQDQQTWDDIIARTKIIQQSVDKNYWDLILIVGEIETKYGESRIGRWADECNIGRSTAYKYRRLSLAGVNQKFVDEWNELGFQKIYQIYEVRRSLTTKSAIEWLEFAKTNPQMNSGVLLSHLQRRVKPFDSDKDFEELQKKADRMVDSIRNKYGDFAADVLSRTLDEMPSPIEAAEEGVSFDVVIETAEQRASKKYPFASREDTEQEQTIDKLVKRSKDMVRWITSNYDDIVESLSLPHEKGDVIRGELSAMIRLLSQVLTTERAPLPQLAEGQVIHIDRKRGIEKSLSETIGPPQEKSRKGNARSKAQ